LVQAETTMLLGQAITGGEVSTVTVKVQMALLPKVSVAVVVTVVVPSGKLYPEGGSETNVTQLVQQLSVTHTGLLSPVQDAVISDPFPQQPSATLTEELTGALLLQVYTTMFSGL